MDSQEFSFKFMVLTVKASLDAVNLTIKQGLKTWKVEVTKLRHLYIIEHTDMGFELILSYVTGADKLKRIRCNANFAEQGFQDLIKAILARRPEIDIRDKPLNEAHKLMGAVNFVRWAPAIVAILVVGIVAFIFLPSLIHGLDFGKQTIDIAYCVTDCPISTGNLKVKGILLPEYAMVLESTQEDTGITTVEAEYYPLVRVDWQEDDPVYMILKTPYTDDYTFEELLRLPAIPGVLRNVLWEGLSSEYRNFFRDEIGINLADNLMLLDYNADTGFEFMISLIVIGSVLLVMLVLAFFIAKKMPK